MNRIQELCAEIRDLQHQQTLFNDPQSLMALAEALYKVRSKLRREFATEEKCHDENY